MARIIAKTGLRKLIAVASAKGMKPTAANISVTPAQPAAVRPTCIAQRGRVKRGRRRNASDTIVANPKTKRPWLICNGCSAGPIWPEASSFAIKVVPAMKRVAVRISASARAGL